jgi:hypothetical protein
MLKNRSEIRRSETQNPSSGSLLWGRVVAAVDVLLHGNVGPTEISSDLDPRIVTGINRQAERVAEHFADEEVGSFARDILTDAAHVIVEMFEVADEEIVDEGASTSAESLLIEPLRRRR